jgi:hypothetical protein
MSDPTNVLALEAMRRRRGGTGDVHLAASPRVVRAQNYGSGVLAHFRLFSLVSTGRERGGSAFELEALERHLWLYATAFADFVAPDTALRLSYSGNGTSTAERLIAATRDAASRAGIGCIEEPEPATAGGYYEGFRFRIHARPSGQGEWLQLVDGGNVDWGARIAGNAKERMLISGVGVERLVALRGQSA